MVNFWLTKKLLVDKDSYFGAESKLGFGYVAMYDELYFVQELRQKIKIFGIPLKTLVKVNTFEVPSEMSGLLRMLDTLEEDDFANFSLTEYVKQSAKIAKELHDKVIHNVKSQDMSDDDRNMFVKMVQKASVSLARFYTFSSKSELKDFKFILDSKFLPLYKLNAGVNTVHYFGRILHDRLDVIAISTIRSKDKDIILTVNQFGFTRDLIRAYVDKVNKMKGVDNL